MKPFSYAFLMILCAHSISYGSTNCQVVEYIDHNEAICIGDEKAKPESDTTAMPSRATIAEYIAQNQPAAQPYAAAATPAAARPQQSAPDSVTVSPPSAAATPAAKPYTAAEHLEMRRIQALRNTGNLMRYTSATKPIGQ